MLGALIVVQQITRGPVAPLHRIPNAPTNLPIWEAGQPTVLRSDTQAPSCPLANRKYFSDTWRYN